MQPLDTVGWSETVLVKKNLINVLLSTAQGTKNMIAYQPSQDTL